MQGGPVSGGSVAVAVLSGGAGRRLGAPKALYRLQGEILAARALRVYSKAGDVYIVARPWIAGRLLRRGLPQSRILLDLPQLPCTGPIAGIATAAALLESYEVVVVIPVDSVWAGPELAEDLARSAGRLGGIVSYRGARGSVYPLHVAGAPKELLKAALAACGHPWSPPRATGVLRAASPLYLLGDPPGGARALATLNTPRDLESPGQLEPPAPRGPLVLEGHSSYYGLAALGDATQAELSFKREAETYRELDLTMLARHAERDAASARLRGRRTLQAQQP